MDEVKKYMKKPVVIEAVQLTSKNMSQVSRWCKGVPIGTTEMGNLRMYIETLEGTMAAKPGDYIIKGIRGEFYPHAGDFFHEVYKEVGH